MITSLFMKINNLMMAGGTGISSLDTGLSKLKTLTVGVVAGIGVVIVGWGGFELGTALFQHDTSQIPNAIKKIVAGVVMIGVGALIGLFT